MLDFGHEETIEPLLAYVGLYRAGVATLSCRCERAFVEVAGENLDGGTDVPSSGFLEQKDGEAVRFLPGGDAFSAGMYC